MLALAAPLLLFGYLLTYAAVANGGVFALSPWAALFADPYEVEAADGGGAGTPAPVGVDPATGRPLRESGGQPTRPRGVDPATGRPARESG